jgi:Flp pilus assembly secretin CpaC
MSKMPGISSIPILGDLFRSKNFNHSVVELVIIVTATVVDPLTSSPLAEPEQPKMATPNLDSNTFDGRAHNLPKGISAPAQQSQPPAPTQTPAQPPTQTPAQPPTQTPAQPKPQAQTQTQSKPQAQPQLQQPAPQVRTDQP